MAGTPMPQCPAAAAAPQDPFMQLPLHPDSIEDKRQFRKLRINELRVVLTTAEEYNSKKVDTLLRKSEKVNSGKKHVVCVLGVRAGSADNPLEYPGLAHLIEHLFLRGEVEVGNPPTRRTYWSDPENVHYLGLPNGSTLEDITLYNCTIPYDDLATTKLQNFLCCFGSADFSETAIRSEIRTLSQEYEYRNRVHGASRFCEVARFFQPQDKPLRHFIWGNYASFNGPAYTGINDAPIGVANLGNANWNVSGLKAALKAFADKHYKLKNCVLVLHGQGDITLDELENLAYAIWQEMTIMYTPDTDQGNEQQQTQQPQQPQQPKPARRKCGDKRKADDAGGCQGSGDASQPPKRPKIAEAKVPAAEVEHDLSPYVDDAAFYKKVYYVQPPEYEDQIYMSWIVDYGGDETKYSKVKPLEYISALIQCCKGLSPTSQSLVSLLVNGGFITLLDVRISKTCYSAEYLSIPWSRRYKAHLFTITLTLTQRGIQERDYVIAAVMCYLGKLKADETVYKLVSELRDMKLETLGVAREAEQSAKHLACAVLYPQKYNQNILTDYARLQGFDAEEINRVLNILKSIDKVNIVIMAHLGEDVNTFAGVGPAFNGANQPLGFSVGKRDLDDNDRLKWSGNVCNTHKDMKLLQMPNAAAIETLEGDQVWEALIQELSDDIAVPAGQRPTGPRDENVSHDQGNRRFFIRTENFRVPFSKIEVQLLPPPFSFSSKLKAWMSLFVEMLKIRIRLVQPTWAQTECSFFKVSVNEFGGVNVRIVGLHHFAVRWLEFLFDCVANPQNAIEPMKALVLESIQKSFLSKIYFPDALCKDLRRRGTLTGYAPLIDSYQHLLRDTVNSRALYLEITGFFQRMKITVYARTNMTDSMNNITGQLKQLPKFNMTPPPGADVYRMAQPWKVTDKAIMIYVISPNRNSFHSYVEHTYQLYGTPPAEGWLSYLRFIQDFVFHMSMRTMRELAGITYTPFIDAWTSYDAASPQVAIGIATDSRWISLQNVSQAIMQMLVNCKLRLEDSLDQDKIQQMGYSLNLQTLLQIWDKFLIANAVNTTCRVYVVQVDGSQASGIQMNPQMNAGPAMLDYPQLFPAVQGVVTHVQQLQYLQHLKGDALMPLPLADLGTQKCELIDNCLNGAAGVEEVNEDDTPVVDLETEMKELPSLSSAARMPDLKDAQMSRCELESQRQAKILTYLVSNTTKKTFKMMDQLSDGQRGIAEVIKEVSSNMTAYQAKTDRAIEGLVTSQASTDRTVQDLTESKAQTDEAVQHLMASQAETNRAMEGLRDQVRVLAAAAARSSQNAAAVLDNNGGLMTGQKWRPWNEKNDEKITAWPRQHEHALRGPAPRATKHNYEDVFQPVAFVLERQNCSLCGKDFSASWIRRHEKKRICLKQEKVRRQREQQQQQKQKQNQQMPSGQAPGSSPNYDLIIEEVDQAQLSKRFRSFV